MNVRPMAIACAIAAIGCASPRAPTKSAWPIHLESPFATTKLATSSQPAPVPDPQPEPEPMPEPKPKDEDVVLVISKPSRPPSGPLRAPALHNPLPGGYVAGYVGDTGLDIGGKQLPVHAIAAASVDYAEAGHTFWTGKYDTPFCVRLALDVPIAWKNKHITHVWYAHLSSLEFTQKEGAKPRRHVDAGEILGISGVANGVGHLHLGLLLDGRVEQDDWAYLLKEGDVRAVLGGYKNGEYLPKF